jgi:hypothetical protein
MNGATPALLLRSPLPHAARDDRLRRVRHTLSALSFWGAIALPAVYLPLLLSGVDTTGGLATFLLLFGLHVSALVGGRRYGQTTRR